MTSSIANKVISYFFIFDFYHMKDSTDDVDLVPESMIYFYSPKEDFKRQKLLDCGEIIGLIQFFQHDLFSSIPKEFHFKKSLVTCEHYGRHSAFLVLSKDRFTTDEAKIHLTHILQLFNMLYGTFNFIQSIYSDIHQIEIYLKQTLTPIIEYVFNENRSIHSLFSAIDYALVKKNDRRSSLQTKHLLSHLTSKYGMQGGLFAYEKRILYSTMDTVTTFYLQVILELEEHLPANAMYIPLDSKTKLKSGVSLIQIYIHRPPSLQPILDAMHTNTTDHTNPPVQSNPIRIIDLLSSNDNEISLLNCVSLGLNYSVSPSDTNYGTSITSQQLGSSSGKSTDFDTDQIEYNSPVKRTDSSSVKSSMPNEKSIPVPQFSTKEFDLEFSPTSPDELRTDEDKRRAQYQRAYSIESTGEYEKWSTSEQKTSRLDDSNTGTLVFEPIDTSDGYESACREEDMIFLPPMGSSASYRRVRQRTLTSYSDFNDTEHNINEQPEGTRKWGDESEKNTEDDRDEYVLYIQRNSRMLFAGIIKKDLLTEEYLRDLWCLMLTEMADMDREIQVIPISGETNKYSSDIRFQFNENSRQTHFERFLVGKRCYYKTPSSDSACLAFNARTKLNVNPERKMIGLSRGNNSISIKRVLPDRVTYSCRRFQESK